MSTNTLLRSARFLAYASGIAYSFVGQTRMFSALLTGQGAVQIGPSSDPLHQAAYVPVMAAGTGPAEFVIGIGFIVIGFMLHGLITVREELPLIRMEQGGEHPVRITVAPKKPVRKEKWYWIEIRI